MTLSTREIAEILHFPVPYGTGSNKRLMCAQDDAWWPCDLIQALNTIDVLQAENTRLQAEVQTVSEDKVT